MGNFISITDRERNEMLETIGISSMEELFADIPQSCRLKGEPALADGKSELEVSHIIGSLADKNNIYKRIFRGAGAYDHYIPEVVKSTVSKESFVTAYTPYQAEISQGILQSIYEYQTYICELTGMDVSNACVYDGAEAAAEAAAMCRTDKRRRVLISETLNPFVQSVIRTYCFGNGDTLEIIPEKEFATDPDNLKAMLSDDVSCVICALPNYYGTLEEVKKLSDITHEAGALFVLSVNPIAEAVLKSAADYGADIAVGEGQPLGMELSFGGPYLGFMATKTKYMRRLPGRIVGETKDTQGKTGYVLTLQAREQHIRREKASSNICSNEALCALRAGVYLSAMGPEGIKQAAVLSMSKAAYLSEGLKEAGFVKLTRDSFHEFVTTSPVPADNVMKALKSHEILGGLPLDKKHKGEILWCCTEKNSKEDMDEVIEVCKEVAKC